MESTPPQRPRRILHVDVDAMFVQCAIFADPEGLAGVSLILVGGSPSGRGVVTSASYACRAYGVRSAMPTGAALRLCPQATVVKVPGAMIRQKNRELAAVLQDWAPIAAMASVDEAYLDLTGTEELYHNEPLEITARRIQVDVKARTGLDVSIGGGSNRLVAKLATSRAKPGGVHIVPAGGEDAFVGELEIGDLIGVGPSFRDALRRRGVVTMTGLRALDLATMASWWGEDRARWLWRRCRGIDDAPIGHRESSRSVSSETTFHRDVTDDVELEEALLGQVADAAESLRRQGLFARTITVKLRDSEFRDRSRSRTLSEGVQTDRIIFSVARELLGDLRRSRGGRVRLIGVGLTKLRGASEEEQGKFLELAPPLEGERDRVLAQVVDRINARHQGAIGPGAAMRGRRRR